MPELRFKIVVGGNKDLEHQESERTSSLHARLAISYCKNAIFRDRL